MKNDLKEIKIWVLIFVVALLLSGISAFPIQTEINFLANHINAFPEFLQQWILDIKRGVNNTYPKYPFLAYGTDWLAFAHIAIAFAFIGVYKKPVQNIWVVEWAMMCCVMVFPVAFICGSIRNIPMFHILIDCSFGVFGFILLFLLRRKIKRLV